MEITDDLVEAVAKQMAFQHVEWMGAPDREKYWLALTDEQRVEYRKRAVELLELIDLETRAK